MKRTYSHHGKQVLTDAGFHLADCITEEAARRIAEALNGWQPIESAPKDGRPILIFEPKLSFGGRPETCHMPREAMAPNEFTYRYDDPRLQWFDDCRFAVGYWRPWGGWGNRNSATVEPTHWMPLPAPPIPADASTPSAGARNATRSVPDVGGGR